MQRLAQAGFTKEFVRPAILPDWWDDTCAHDPSLLPDIEIRVARFLGISLSTVRDASTALAAPAYPGAQLRRVWDLDRDRLAPAIHAGMRIAAAVVRSLREPVPDVALPAPDGLAWRNQIERAGEIVGLDDILGDLWQRGIPVVPLDVLPAPSFQGLACMVEGRPVILLGHKHDEPGRLAFVVAHEVSHAAAGDCAIDRPVVDEEDEVADDAELERRADRFATRALVGGDSIPHLPAGDFKELAKGAFELERSKGADATAIIFAWARNTGDYGKASMAVKALYRGSGARKKLRRYFDRHVDLDAANESDRALLLCVHGDPERDASAA